MARATWHVAPRDKRDRRSGALALLLVFVASKSAQPFRSYSRKSLDRHTHPQTDKQARPSCKNPPYPEEISIHQNGLTPILLHYDFELEAICFEPLSFVLSFSFVFLCNFELVMFIEAGDVTHRRRGQNRNEGLSKNFLSFLHRKFFLTQICVFWPNSSRNDQIKNFRKNQNFDPPNFWTP